MNYLKSLWQSFFVRLSTVRGLFSFLWQNKMWWMIPLVGVLVVFFLIMVFAQSSPLGPFIYTLF